MDNKSSFFEKRFGSENGIGPSGWLMLAIAVIVVLLAFLLFWLPEYAPSLSLRSYFGGETTETTGASGAVVERNAAGVERVLENGRYVTRIYFTNGNFVPSSVVIDQGESVRFINQDNLSMRVGSRAENLSSTYYSGISQPSVAGNGGTFEYTFTQAGVWAYENLPSGGEPKPRGVIFVR